MRFNLLTLSMLCALMCISFGSCIRSEAPNSECDIISATLPEDILLRSPVVTNNAVDFTLKLGVSPDKLAPEFVLTPGATIVPASGTVRDFTEPQTYVVTSQDGDWSKTYTVNVNYTLIPDNPDDPVNPDDPDDPSEKTIVYKYAFENVKIAEAQQGRCKYDVFYEIEDGREKDWASANGAFALTGQGSTPETFPTYQVTEGVVGQCVQLVTRSTGSFGALVKKPIAAGNLFLGTFDMAVALASPLKATHFGVPFYREPSMFSGYYKYKPGETYCEPDATGNLVPVAGMVDDFNIYAVLFEVTDGVEWLNGENVLSEDNPNIIMTALIPDRHASEDWVEFSVPFVYRDGKSIDQQKLKNGHYSIAVVMSSSSQGDYFCGAVGSTLTVDELSITCIDETTDSNNL